MLLLYPTLLVLDQSPAHRCPATVLRLPAAGLQSDTPQHRMQGYPVRPTHQPPVILAHLISKVCLESIDGLPADLADQVVRVVKVTTVQP